jgi:hypothetical protein
MSTILTIVAFQAVWLVCAAGAAAGVSWPGVAAATVLALAHVALAPTLAPGAAPGTARGRTAATLLASGALGAAAEHALVAVGSIDYGPAAAGAPTGVPAWIVALWVAFATTVPVLARWFGTAAGGWPWTAAAVGAVGGPLAYVAGERLGALTLAPAAWWTAVAALALVWAVATPLLLALHARLRNTGGG